jgi:hypothetical protein
VFNSPLLYSSYNYIVPPVTFHWKIFFGYILCIDKKIYIAFQRLAGSVSILRQCLLCEGKVKLASAPVGGEWSASHPGCFTPRERVPSSHYIGGWVCLRAGLDDLEKRKFLALPGLEREPLCDPVHNQSLY